MVDLEMNGVTSPTGVRPHSAFHRSPGMRPERASSQAARQAERCEPACRGYATAPHRGAAGSVPPRRRDAGKGGGLHSKPRCSTVAGGAAKNHIDRLWQEHHDT